MTVDFTVVYDACVLYPAPLRSLLMHLALSDLFRARWCNKIHEEWMRNVLKSRPDLTQESLLRVRDLMNFHARGALVSNFETLIHTIELPDRDDRHVVAVAIHANAEAIITFNLRDFPQTYLEPYNLKAVHPDDFITDLMDFNLGSVIEAARRHRAELKNPIFTVDQYLNCLVRQQLTQTVARLRSFSALI